ncbi:MAG: hypothetical protein HY873_14355 [Chloroflexi bacterium]|nr:hypothetical protein [Chloroflexota bacterium]
MSGHEWLIGLYALNFSLLMTHQVDSSYWEEWDLFHIPGGNQLNLVFNLVLLLVGMAGFGFLVAGRAAGDYLALILAGAGLFAFCIHAFFLARGDQRFRQPASLVLLIALLPLSVAMGLTSVARF